MAETQSEWERFRDAYAGDLEMQEELDRRLQGAERSAIARIVHDYARQAGFEVESDAVERFFANAPKPVVAPEELSDAELERVAGGASRTPGYRVVPSQTKALLLAP